MKSGHADDDRAFLKWTAQWEAALALDRSPAVADYFIGLGIFRPDRILAVSGGGGRRPFRSDSEQNRVKNRTVALRVAVVL